MSRLRHAYNTNGLQNHRLDDALHLLADTGYDGVALTLDHAHLDPFAEHLTDRTAAVRRRLQTLGLGCVVETGARFLLDPRRKHEPTFVTADPDRRAERLEFLRAATRIAHDLEAECVSFWAGVPAPGVDRDHAWRWLVDGVCRLAETAAPLGVTLAFEPEPGMLVETVDQYRGLAEAAPSLRLALDVGHCLVTGDREPQRAVVECAGELGTVAIEDMRRGEHIHRAFGEGDLDLSAVLGALVDVEWGGLVCVELSRDSHRAHELVATTLEALRAAEPALR